jgi:hypothetical protein
VNARHPTIDEIADHNAGLTSAPVDREIAEHLSSCPECRAVEARLNDVADQLASAGTEPLTMPEDVVARLDDALAAAAVEHAAGVPSLADRRVTKVSEEQPEGQSAGRPRPRGRWVLGAAAAVVVFAVGGAVLANGLPGSTSSSDSTAGSADDSRAGAGQSGGGGAVAPENTFHAGGEANADGARVPPPKLDADSVGAYARDLANAQQAHLPTAATLPRAMRCGIPVDTTDVAGRNSLQAYVLFDGDPALLRVKKSPRELTVFSCPGPNRVLYSSPY